VDERDRRWRRAIDGLDELDPSFALAHTCKLCVSALGGSA
jgi:hypothetical protein